jgi:hypothetical protein
MKYFQLLTPNYSALKHEEEDELAHGLSPRIRKRGHVFRTLLILSLISLCFCAFTHWTDIPSAPKKNGCSTISLRREWRTLTSDQRQNYIRAVQCLKTRPSRLGLNHTLYDDFPWIHSRVGEYGTYISGSPALPMMLTHHSPQCCTFPRLASILRPHLREIPQN